MMSVSIWTGFFCPCWSVAFNPAACSLPQSVSPRVCLRLGSRRVVWVKSDDLVGHRKVETGCLLVTGVGAGISGLLTAAGHRGYQHDRR